MAKISSGVSADLLTIDATSKAARATIYGPDGSTVSRQDRSTVVPGTQSGMVIAGADGRTARLARVMSDGALAVNRQIVHLFDPIEGAAYNSNTWTQTLAGSATINQSGGAITLNNSGLTTSGAGVLHSAQRLVLLPGRGRIMFRSRQRHTAHFQNNLIELGFMTPSSATATAIGTGAVWRKDGTGQYVPLLCFGGSETLGTPISNATFVASIPTTEYALFEVDVDEQGAWFRIFTATGAVVNEQRVDLPNNQPDWGVSHLTPAYRTYNNAATSSAVQLLVGETTVVGMDFDSNKPWSHQMSGNGWSALQSPTAYTQTANHSNNNGPTSRTVSNTSAAETTLGGQVQWTSTGPAMPAAGETDYVLFAYQVPSPYAFYLTGVRISTLNVGVAVTTLPTTLLYSIAANGTAAALNTGGPRYMPLGWQSAAVGVAAGAPYDRDTVWTPGTPICIQAGRFLHLAARVVTGNATANQQVRTVATFDGYFE